MTDLVHCSFCNTNQICTCRKSGLRFFELLNAVNNRVLTQKETSPLYLPPRVIKTGIDKLEGNLNITIEEQKVLQNCENNGVQANYVWLNNKSKYLKLTLNTCSIYLKPINSKITQITSNPNEFLNWSEYYEFLLLVLNNEIVQNIKITRLDLNIDFALPLHNLIQQIDLPNKSTSHSHQSKSGNLTGLYIGKGNEFVSIYDKAEESGLSTPITRLELRLRSKMLSNLYMANIPKLLKSKRFFDRIKGASVAFASDNYISLSSKNKLDEFKKTLEREGLYSARKVFNQSKNFNRDFKNLISLRPWAIQPQELFEKHITTFFKGEESWMPKIKEQ